MTKFTNLLFSNFLHICSFVFVVGVVAILFLILDSPPTFAQFSETDQSSYLPQSVEFETQSRFTKKYVQNIENIPFKTEYQKTDNLEFGVQNVKQEGQNGKLIKTIEITYFEGEEYGRRVSDEKTEDPQNKIVELGTKKVYRTENTPNGSVNFYAKFRVWSTSYDKYCHGCNETTATGMKAGYGVIAVDPSIIPLGTHVYVPGYGFAIAGDTGGAIKGYKIDLGFDDVRTGWWSSRYTDIYLLD